MYIQSELETFNKFNWIQTFNYSYSKKIFSKEKQQPFGNIWVCQFWQTIPVNQIPSEIWYLTKGQRIFYISTSKIPDFFPFIVLYKCVHIFFRSINAWPTRRLIGITCSDDCLMYRGKKRKGFYGRSSFFMFMKIWFSIYFFYAKRGFDWLIALFAYKWEDE